MGGWRGIGVVLSWGLWWVSWWGDGLGYEFLCHDVGLGYGVCSLVGFFIDDAGLGLGVGGDNVPCSGGVLSHARLVVGLAG